MCFPWNGCTLLAVEAAFLPSFWVLVVQSRLEVVAASRLVLVRRTKSCQWSIAAATPGPTRTLLEGEQLQQGDRGDWGGGEGWIERGERGAQGGGRRSQVRRTTISSSSHHSDRRLRHLSSSQTSSTRGNEQLLKLKVSETDRLTPFVGCRQFNLKTAHIRTFSRRNTICVAGKNEDVDFPQFGLLSNIYNIAYQNIEKGWVAFPHTVL